MLLAHDDQGSGPAVVLIHAGVCDRRMWEAQAAALSASYRVIRPDLRGFGETPLPGENFSFSGDVVALLDHLRVERASVVGSSLGGRVALEVASIHRDRVTSLVLLCSALDGVESTPDADAFDEREEQLIGAGDLGAAVELNVDTWLGPDASADTRDLVRRMQRHAFEVQLAAEEQDPEPELSWAEVDMDEISVPTLVVSGNRDLDHFRHVAQHLASAIPGSRLEVLPWAAHLPSLERPDETTALIADFLATTT